MTVYNTRSTNPTTVLRSAHYALKQLIGDSPILFLLAVAVAAHELVHATCGVDKLLLTGEEGV